MNYIQRQELIDAQAKAVAAAKEYELKAREAINFMEAWARVEKEREVKRAKPKGKKVGK